MTFLDSSVLVAALVEGVTHHEECLALVTRGGHMVLEHALIEAFSTLTGGRTFERIPPDTAAQAVASCAQTFLTVVHLTGPQVLDTLTECHARGIRGGAIHDYRHLKAASVHQADRLYTLNLRHFLAFHRPSDPEVVAVTAVFE